MTHAEIKPIHKTTHTYVLHCRQQLQRGDLPDHVHHEYDVEDDEEVVCVPEDLIVGHPENESRPGM